MDDKTKFTFDAINPIFDQDSTDRLFSWPFKMPLSAHNKVLINHTHRPDSVHDSVKIDVDLYIMDLPFKRGVLEVGPHGTKYTQAKFYSGGRKLMEELEAILLKSLFSTITIPGNFDVIIELELQAAYDYYININGTGFSYTTGTGEDLVTVGNAIRDLVNAAFPGLAQFIPYPTNRFILSGGGIYDSIQVDLIGMRGFNLVLYQNSTTGSITRMADFIDDSITTPRKDIAFPILWNSAFYKYANSSYTYIVNHWKDGALIQNVYESESDQWLNTVIPFVRVPHILQQLFSTNEKTYSGGFTESSDFSQLLIYNNFSLDEVSEDVSLGWINHFKGVININDHVPEMNAKQFVQAFTTFFGQYMTVDGSHVSFKSKRDQLIHPAIDWSHKTEPNHTKNNFTGDGFTISFQENDSDANASSPLLFPYKWGEGTQKIPLAAMPLITNDLYDPSNGAKFRLAAIGQEGSNTLGLGSNKYGLRFFFDRGVKSDSLGKTYNMSSSIDTDLQDNPVGNLSLYLHGATGIYQTHHKGVAELQSTGSLVKRAKLDIQDLLYALRWENSKRKVLTEDGEYTGIIKSIRFKGEYEWT